MESVRAKRPQAKGPLPIDQSMVKQDLQARSSALASGGTLSIQGLGPE